MVSFYTGFANYSTLKACYNFLQSAVNNLTYWDSGRKSADSETLCKLKAPKPSSTGRSLIGKGSSIQFRCFTMYCVMYLEDFLFKHISLWPSKQLVNAYMPKCFRVAYPTTRVILDATEFRARTKKSLLKLQEHKYVYHHQVLSLCVSKVCPSSIADIKLHVTSCSQILYTMILSWRIVASTFRASSHLLVQNKILSLLKGKNQLSVNEKVETQRIASIITNTR